jgi:hypothetical protein
MVSNQSYGSPTWNTQKQQYSTVLHPQMRNADIVTPLTNLSSGIVRSRVWHSTSSYATDLILNHVNSYPAQSICVSVLCAVLHTKPRIGLLSTDLAAGIRRVKGVKKLGVRLGNWLTAEQGQALWQAPDQQRLKGKRDRAMLALLLACGLRRHEAVALRLDHLSNVRSTGQSWIWLARAVIFELFLFPIGCEASSTIG